MNPYAMHQVGKARQRDLLEAAHPSANENSGAPKLTLTLSSLAVIGALIVLVL